MAAAVHLTLIAPDNEKFTVQLAPARLPRRKPNVDYRSRVHLIEREVERLIEAMKGNRWGHRDATMVLIAIRCATPSWRRLGSKVYSGTDRFEATVGGSATRGSSNFSRKSR